MVNTPLFPGDERLPKLHGTGANVAAASTLQEQQQVLQVNLLYFDIISKLIEYYIKYGYFNKYSWLVSNGQHVPLLPGDLFKQMTRIRWWYQ